jgi:hypothetical protein
MPFTTAELEHASNTLLEYYMDRGKVFEQAIQEKPIYDMLRKKQKSFPGGKDELSCAVKGVHTPTIEGFESDDEVSYVNPANVRRARYPWKLHHAGIKFTKHELLKAGISIKDGKGKQLSTHSEAEKIQLVDFMGDKVSDLAEGWAEDFQTLLWGDGTADSKKLAGVRSIVVDDPTTATVVGGIDQSSNSWWRNRASLAIDSSTASDNNLINKMQTEWRQLRRYGGRPDMVLCGSDWLEAAEKEMRSKGTYTDTGWRDSGKLDPAMPDLAFKGVAWHYDPSLDDIGRAKYCYVFDTRKLTLMPIEGEDMQRHFPERSEKNYVFYRSITWVGGLTCKQRNCHGVYSIA